MFLVFQRRLYIIVYENRWLYRKNGGTYEGTNVGRRSAKLYHVRQKSAFFHNLYAGTTEPGNAPAAKRVERFPAEKRLNESPKAKTESARRFGRSNAGKTGGTENTEPICKGTQNRQIRRMETAFGHSALDKIEIVCYNRRRCKRKQRSLPVSGRAVRSAFSLLRAPVPSILCNKTK